MDASDDALARELNELARRLTAAPGGAPAGAPCLECGEPETLVRLTLEASRRWRDATGPRTEDERRFSFDLAAMPVTDRVLGLAQADATILSDFLARESAALSRIIGLIGSGRVSAAIAELDRIGMTEETFKARGGGIWGLLVVAVVIVLVAATPTSSTADPVPLPDTPVEVDPETAADMDSYYGD